MMSERILLPSDVLHGTPEGHAGGCKGDRAHCPAEAEHGMSCTAAYVRSTTTPDRYFKAKARDPRPAAIARTLGYTPVYVPAPVVNPRARKPRPVDTTPAPAPAPAEVPTKTATPTPTEDAEDAAAAASAAEPAEPAPSISSKPKRTAKPATAPKPVTTPRAAKPAKPISEAKQIRTWAAANGMDCPTHGRIPFAIQDAYAARDTTPTTDPALEQLQGQRDSARALAARLWDELVSLERSVTFVLQKWGAATDARDLVASRQLDTLGFIDRTIDCNEDNRPDLPWANTEVLDLLHMIRTSLVDGTRERTHP